MLSVQSLPIWLFTLSSSAVVYVGSWAANDHAGARPALDRPGPAREVRLTRGTDGLFHVRATIDGVTTDAVLDTGASRSIVGKHLIGDLVRGGARLYDDQTADPSLRTMNGRVRYAVVPVGQFTVEGFDLGPIDAITVPDADAPTVLGQDAIARFASITIAADQLVLR